MAPSPQHWDASWLGLWTNAWRLLSWSEWGQQVEGGDHSFRQNEAIPYRAMGSSQEAQTIPRTLGTTHMSTGGHQARSRRVAGQGPQWGVPLVKLKCPGAGDVSEPLGPTAPTPSCPTKWFGPGHRESQVPRMPGTVPRQGSLTGIPSEADLAWSQTAVLLCRHLKGGRGVVLCGLAESLP